MEQSTDALKRSAPSEDTEEIKKVNPCSDKFTNFYREKLGQEPAFCPPLPLVNWELRPKTKILAQELQRDLHIAPIPEGKALGFSLWGRCGRARAGCVSLPHGPVETPVFMPVGTQAVIKGISPDELLDLNIQIILNNTYHLANRPGCETLDEAGGSHKFMRWSRNILTDSGGFQMVSLLKLACITEEGVEFEHPINGNRMLLTPEKSIESQNSIGSDIMMQLDDVVDVGVLDKARIEEATYRTFRWLDRCIKAHKRPEVQNLFGIVQGGLHPDLRAISLKGMKERDLPGYAIGGLSGGEAKDSFWKIVELCTRPPTANESEDQAMGLPTFKPRYLMGVGYPLDMICCMCLGVDMFDCVFACRTARFGTALVSHSGGSLRIKQSDYSLDPRPLDEACACSTCKNYSRAALHALMTKEPTIGRLLTIHNLTYTARLLEDARAAILRGTLDKYVEDFLMCLHPKGEELSNPCPPWVRDCLLKSEVFDEERIHKLYDWDTAQRVWCEQEQVRETARNGAGPMKFRMDFKE